MKKLIEKALTTKAGRSAASLSVFALSLSVATPWDGV